MLIYKEILEQEKNPINYRANYKLAQETLEQAKSQLDIGFTTIYDYLISVDGLIRAKTAQDEGRFDLLSSYYALLHASGKESEK